MTVHLDRTDAIAALGPDLTTYLAIRCDSSGQIIISNPGGGGSGGAVTLIDGGDVTQGSKADAAITDPTLSATEIALLKGVLTRLSATLAISAASLPLPAGASTAAGQATGNTSLSSLVTLHAAGLPSALGAGGGLKVDGSGTALPVSGTITALISPQTSGGLSIFRSINLLATGLNVKSTAGQLYGYYITNLAASTRYLKIYDKATAPTIGTDTPVITIPLAAGASANVSHPNGIAFANGIGIGATTGIADADTTAPAANECIVNLYFK